MSSEQHRYLLKNVSMKALSTEIEALWEQLQKPGSKLRKDALAKGIAAEELKELSGRKYNEVIKLKKGAAMDPASVALIVAFAPVAAKITKDLWDLFLIRLKRRFGRDSIEPKDTSKK
jgi:hypothetical protein